MVNGVPRVRDFFLSSRAECSGVSGVCRDDAAGFIDDISEVSSDTAEGFTVIRYRKPLVPSDVAVSSADGGAIDQIVSTEAGVATFIVWVSPCMAGSLVDDSAGLCSCMYLIALFLSSS
jgi:hypothetical protein